MQGFTEVMISGHVPRMDDYRKLELGLIDRLSSLAGDLRGKTIIHINATAQGGGVAEILMSQVPLERELGLNSRWFTINVPEEFFVVTKKIHNLLQGQKGSLADEEKDLYLKVNEGLGASFSFLDDVKEGIVVFHDPQPMAAVVHLPDRFIPISRVHMDLSTPNQEAVDFLRPFLEKYHKVIISSGAYRAAFPWLEDSKFQIVTPAIDPFSNKNKRMEPEEANKILAGLEVNIDKPIVSQVSRFDPWKDPLGTINAYYMAKNQIPDLQLILAGIMQASDDPEAKELFKKVDKHAEGDPDIFLFSRLDQLGDVPDDVFINAVQTASDLILQMSIREGFGLTVTEAMWKGKTVVARHAVGTDMQIDHGKNGFLVSSPLEAAGMVIELIKNPVECHKLGLAARKSVSEKFLIPKMLMDHLEIYKVISG